MHRTRNNLRKHAKDTERILMNPLERQLQLGRELFEINANAWRKLAEFDSETLRKYNRICN